MLLCDQHECYLENIYSLSAEQQQQENKYLVHYDILHNAIYLIDWLLNSGILLRSVFRSQNHGFLY